MPEKITILVMFLKIPAEAFGQPDGNGFVELVLNGGVAGGGNNQDITPVGECSLEIHQVHNCHQSHVGCVNSPKC